MTSDDLIGRRVAGYDVLELLGAGGMGRVYRARQISLDREVAFKILAPSAAMGPELHARFMREGQLQATFSHPNLVKVLDVGQDEEQRRFIAMELVRGLTLARELDRYAPFPVPFALCVAHSVASALAHLHANSVMHRDLKPGNVLISQAGEVKLVDFGLARSSSQTMLTRAGDVLGTPRYMAPECFSGGTAGTFTDQYALGHLLYEMLAGRSPYSGNDVREWMSAVCRVLPQPLSPRRADVPEPVDDLLLSLLAKDPARRPTAAQTVERLEGILEPLGKTPQTQRSLSAILSRGCLPTAAIPLRVLKSDPPTTVAGQTEPLASAPVPSAVHHALARDPRFWAGWICGAITMVVTMASRPATRNPPVLPASPAPAIAAPAPSRHDVSALAGLLAVLDPSRSGRSPSPEAVISLLSPGAADGGSARRLLAELASYHEDREHAMRSALAHVPEPPALEEWPPDAVATVARIWAQFATSSVLLDWARELGRMLDGERGTGGEPIIGVDLHLLARVRLRTASLRVVQQHHERVGVLIRQLAARPARAGKGAGLAMLDIYAVGMYLRHHDVESWDRARLVRWGQNSLAAASRGRADASGTVPGRLADHLWVLGVSGMGPGGRTHAREARELSAALAREVPALTGELTLLDRQLAALVGEAR